MENDYTKVDKSIFNASRKADQGNADFQYWFNKSVKERLNAAAVMISVAYRIQDFLKTKVDRTVYSSRKQKL
ncbi:MAG TPA: hypothetical protein VFG54_04320 [Prolixibacteraceae bacterium]|nr:hypothetical protein [Prolixibacteraceae bacterium]